ncbi:hypothetical protein PENTCL1PPCAC_24404 [Pristionchus entomophagus]|uniref:Uncharacterized protein n=1 Tax=Pristionchus entomophagus TaxID=358040 RepID=A0AAV5U765_9BILA|nr:hypothetical protein PENTCL1PPCAC_24404 [Pristionchus entomophagus]
MKFVLLALLSLPAAMALKCNIGGGTTWDNVKANSVDVKDTAKYCYTFDGKLLNQPIITKDADIGNVFCEAAKTTQIDNKVLGMGTLICCSGDDCNPASSASILMTVLTAAVAAFRL